MQNFELKVGTKDFRKDLLMILRLLHAKLHFGSWKEFTSYLVKFFSCRNTSPI